MAVLAGLFCSVVLARLMGPSEYGVYAYIFAIISVLALPAQMGTPTLVVRETAQAVAEQDWPKVRGIWSWAVLLIVIGSTMIIGIALVWLYYFGVSESDSRYLPFLWGLPLIPLLGLSATAAAALLGLKRVFLAQFPDQILRPVLFAILLGIGVILYPQLATASAGLTFLCATLSFTLVLIFYFLYLALPKDLQNCKKTRMENRKWIGAILPLSLITGLQLVSQNTDLLMLGFLRSNEEVALYKIALSISTLTILGLTTFNMVMQPYIAELYHKQEMNKLQLTISIGAAAATVVTVPVVAIFVLAGRDLISLLYGTDYADAGTALVILCLGSVSTAYFGVAGVLLTMASLENVVVKLLFTSTLSNVLLNALLIPEFGMAGAATATGSSIVILNVLLWRTAKIHTELDCSPRDAIKNIGSSLMGRIESRSNRSR